MGMHEYLEFGDAAHCKTVAEAAAFVRNSPSQPLSRRLGVALGMVLAARRQAESTPVRGYYRQDALEVLDALGRAKADLDTAALHDPDLTQVSAAILSAAQAYAWEMTIPCTEWPSPRELAEVALGEARRLITVG